MPNRTRAARAVVADFPATPRRRSQAPPDAYVEALAAQAKATDRLAAAIESGVEAFQPAADALHTLGEAQQKFCAFMVGNRLKIVAALSALPVAIGAISPNAAHALAVILKAFGAA